MIGHRFAAATLVVLACAALVAPRDAGARASVERVERSEAVVDVAGLKALSVDNARGPVELRPSTDGRLHLTAIKTIRAESEIRRDRYARELVVHAGREADRYVVRVDYPRRVDVHIGIWELFSHRTWDGPVLPRIELHLLAEVPPGLAVTVNTVNSDIASTGLAGSQTLATTSGDITVSDARGRASIRSVSGSIALAGVGPVEAQTVSGDVEVTGARSALAATTTSGNVTIDGATDSLHVDTTSGDVVVDDAPHGLRIGAVSGEVVVRSAAGRVQITTSSGDVRCGLREPSSGARLESTSGSVQLAVANGFDARLDLRTASGSLECHVPIRMLQSGRKELSGDLGRGGPVVQLRSASGDLTVTNGGK